MASDKRELILDLLARDRSGPAVKGFAKGIKDAGDAADKAGASTKKFGEGTEKAGRGADELGDQADGAAKSIAKLDREIALANAELQVLAKSFADTDDAAQRLDLSKAIRKAENDIRRLTKSRGLIKIDVPVEIEPDMPGFFKKLSMGIGSAGGSVASAAGGSVGPVVGGAIGVAAAPVLVSSMASALSAGAGLGVLGAGIALAVSKDEKIKHAGSLLGQKFIGALAGAASNNLGVPITRSLGILEGAADRSVKKMDRAFRSLAPSLVPFTRDVVASAERMEDAFVNTARKSGPAVEGLGGSLRLLADGAGDFVETLADGSPEAAANLQLVAGATADLARYTGVALSELNKLSGNPWITGPLLPALRQHYVDAADSTGVFSRHTKGAKDAMEGAAEAAQGQRNALDELNKALRAETDPVFALLDAQDQLKRAQKASSKAIEEHGEKSDEAQTALRELAAAALNLQGRAGALGDAFSGEVTPQLRATLKTAGLTDKQISELGRQFRNAKRSGDQFAKTYSANVKVNGVAKAKGDLRSVREIASDIPRAITIAMRITGVTNVSKARAAINKQYEARASGGPVQRGVPYWVGEEGPELIMPEHNGHVLSAGASKAAARSTSGRGVSSAGGGVLQLEVVGEQQVVTLVRSLIRKANLLQPEGQ
jgi:hypothetical protein